MQSLASGNVQAAYGCYQSATRVAPDLADAWYMLGGVHVMVGQGGAALPFFERAVALQPGHAEAWFEMGNVQLSQMQPHLAERSLATAVRALRSVAIGGGGGGGRASEARGVVASMPADALLATVLSNLGNAQLELGRAAEAAARYEESVATGAPLCIAVNGLSNALEAQGKHDAAVAACVRGARLLPSCDLAFYNRGRLLRAAASRQAEAASAHREAVRLAPQNAQYVNAYGTALQSEDNRRAARAYRDALALAPAWSAPYRNLGLLEYEEGRSVAALELFATVVRLEPTSAETYADMGTAHLERRDLLLSLREYERALQLQPTNALAHANLVYLRTKLRDWTGDQPRPSCA